MYPTLHAHVPHVSQNHPAPDRFDVLRRDRMQVGAILSYFRTLVRIGRLAERVEEVEKQLEVALEAMGRIALETFQLEAEARTPGGFIPTPVDVLELSLPPISGGAPFEPSEEDWADYHAYRDNPLTEADIRVATGAY